MSTKICIDYATFLDGSRALAYSLSRKHAVDLILCVPRGGMSFAHVLSLELGVGVEMLDFTRASETELRDRYGGKKILVVDDSIGTGNTFRQIGFLMHRALIDWHMAVFYVDHRFPEDNDVSYVMKSSLWVVLPYEDKDRIEEGNQNALFRNGTDSYQRKP